MTPTSIDCVFCDIVNEVGAAQIIASWDDCIAFVPLGAAAPGHTLVIPRLHVRDALVDPDVTAYVMRRAAQLARRIGAEIGVEEVNLLTSAGVEATQTVMHLHVHIVPRGQRDKLPRRWPWRWTT